MNTILHKLSPEAEQWRQNALLLGDDLLPSWGAMAQQAHHWKNGGVVATSTLFPILPKMTTSQAKASVRPALEWMSETVITAQPDQRASMMVYAGIVMSLSPLFPIRLSFHPVYHIIHQALCDQQFDLAQMAFEQLVIDNTWEEHHRLVYSCFGHARLPNTREGLVMQELVCDGIYNEGALWLLSMTDQWSHQYDMVSLLDQEIIRQTGEAPHHHMPCLMAHRTKRELLQCVAQGEEVDKKIM